jgi:hypothetical protein
MLHFLLTLLNEAFFASISIQRVALQVQVETRVVMQSSRKEPVIIARFQTKFLHVGIEVFIAVVMNSIIFWGMIQCSPLSFNRRFGGTYRLHLQGRRNRFRKSASKQVATLN